MLGRTVRDQIFGAGAPAVGRTVTIHGRTFTVVGVTDTADPDQIEMAFVPYTALQDALGIDYLHTITIEAAQAGDASRIAADVDGAASLAACGAHRRGDGARCAGGGIIGQPDAAGRRSAAGPTTSR